MPAGPVPVRPEIHYSPAATWLNDPNGLIFHDSLWHLYYQTNPNGLSWGNMSWGHATSPDLTRWTEHAPAIWFDDTEAVFSGSMVCDTTDSAGFGADALVAIYTSHREDPDGGVHRAQWLAWSTDGGHTFHKFAGNPVLDRQSSDFRDPKVFRHEGRWIMVAVETVENAIVIYDSDNLRDWRLLSEFRSPSAAAPTWECPDLFPLVDEAGATCWVLILSVNQEALTGGSGTRYFLGDFDGRVFRPAVGEGQRGWLDHGRDYYAAVSFTDAPAGRRVMIGWMNNWEYAHQLPAHPWTMQMAWPRELGLEGSGPTRRLLQAPVALPTEPGADGPLFEGVLDGELTLPSEVPAVIDLELQRGGATGVELSVGLTLAWEADTLTVQARGGVLGAPPGFDRPVTTTLPGDSHTLRVLVDHGSVEVFLDGGRQAHTHLCAPAAVRVPWTLRTTGGPAGVRVAVRRVRAQGGGTDEPALLTYAGR